MNYTEVFTEHHQSLMEAHPELEAEITFASAEVPAYTPLVSLEDRMLSQLAVCLGAQGKEELEDLLQAALDLEIDPVKIRETFYQSIAYLGLARTRASLQVLETVCQKRKIAPDSMQTTDADSRLAAGNAKQVELFGQQMKESWLTSPIHRKNISRFLADNCFGDFYTRKGLDNRQRELVTFCFLYAQGGCEPQATSHALANLHQGNSADYLCQVVDACIPLIGYPRSLNAIACIEKAQEMKGNE